MSPSGFRIVVTRVVKVRHLALTAAWLIGFLAVVSLLVWAGASRPGSEAQVSGSVSSVDIYTTTVTLPTYPYAGCLEPTETGAAGVPYRALDWECLNQAGGAVSQTYTLLVLSNPYLTVTLLPELGGRVYEMIFKPTGHNELYRNPVIKPAPFGPPEMGWWLAVGGLEWGFPTDEHGYAWGRPWEYRVVTDTAGVTVTLREDDGNGRPTLHVDLHLAHDRAALRVRPQLVNPTAGDVELEYWTDALLAPGSANSPGAELRFLFAGDRVTVHSRGDAELPPPGELMDWPVHDGRDYGRLGNWNRWLGFFEAPQAHGPFAGVYDPLADEGVLRVYPADVARGSKGFAFGWDDPLPPDLWTDDGSAYVEVHGGLTPTFWDTATLSAGEVVSWTEVWYPVAGIGGVSAASEEAALRLERVGETLMVGLYTPAAHDEVTLYLWRDGCTRVGQWRRSGVDPARPLLLNLPARGLVPDQLNLVALAEGNVPLIELSGQDCLAPVAAVKPLPSYVTTTTFGVAWHGVDVGSGVAAYDLQTREGYGGQWVDWLTGTTALSSTFTGVDGQTYFFRVRARDRAGNASAFGDEEWGQAFTTVLLSPSPVLVASRKSAHPVQPAPGRAVSYTVRLSNTGNLTATGVVLTDHLPATLALISGTLQTEEGSLAMPSQRLVTWHGALPPGREVWLRYALTATSATTPGAELTNTLHVAADGLAPLARWAGVTFLYPIYLPLVAQSQ